MAVEFGVHAPPGPVAPSGFTVIGRVTLGSVRVGDVFTEAEGPRTRWNEASTTVKPVRLRVVEARLWQLLQDEIDAGYSAELLLDGHGRDALQERVLIRHHSR